MRAVPFRIQRCEGLREIEKSHLRRAYRCYEGHLIPASRHMGDIETPTAAKYHGLTAVMAKAVGNWPVAVLGIAGLCTVAWVFFLIWLMANLLRRAFA